MNRFNKGKQMTALSWCALGTSVMLTVYDYREVSSAFEAGITTSETFEGLELYEGKLSRAVLRRGLGCKAQLLSGPL